VTYLLVAALCIAIGWCWGHSTARIRHVPIGATQADDEAAFIEQQRRQFEQRVASLDLPDDPDHCTRKDTTT
jgi:hypothetical protein